jgi:threonine aldolase
MDESTAPEFFTGGARMIPVTNQPEKLSAKIISEHLQHAGIHLPHNPAPAVVTITQASENGMVYTPDEVSAIAQVSHEHGLKLHMDGARFANAIASLECSPADITWRSGVDVLCLGATKNGALCAEAVIFFDQALAADFEHRRKRAGHLLSKGRLFGAQFCGWLEEEHWLDLARHANQQANRIAEELSTIDDVRLVWPVEANELFVILPKTKASMLEEAGAEFYDWYPVTLPDRLKIKDSERLIRLVTSFRTTAEECDQLASLLAD